MLSRANRLPSAFGSQSSAFYGHPTQPSTAGPTGQVGPPGVISPTRHSIAAPDSLYPGQIGVAGGRASPSSFNYGSGYDTACPPQREFTTPVQSVYSTGSAYNDAALAEAAGSYGGAGPSSQPPTNSQMATQGSQDVGQDMMFPDAYPASADYEFGGPAQPNPDAARRGKAKSRMPRSHQRIEPANYQESSDEDSAQPTSRSRVQGSRPTSMKQPSGTSKHRRAADKRKEGRQNETVSSTRAQNTSRRPARGTQNAGRGVRKPDAGSFLPGVGSQFGGTFDSVADASTESTIQVSRYTPTETEEAYIKVLAEVARTDGTYGAGSGYKMEGLNNESLARGFEKLAIGILDKRGGHDRSDRSSPDWISPQNADLDRIHRRSLILFSHTDQETGETTRVLNSTMSKALEYARVVSDRSKKGEKSEYLQPPEDPRLAEGEPFIHITDKEKETLSQVINHIALSGMPEPRVTQYSQGIQDLYDYGRAKSRKFAIRYFADDADTHPYTIRTKLPGRDMLKARKVKEDDRDKETYSDLTEEIKQSYEGILDKLDAVRTGPTRSSGSTSATQPIPF